MLSSRFLRGMGLVLLLAAIFYIGNLLYGGEVKEALSVIGAAVTAFGGAWAGGHAAFYAEAQRRDKSEKEIRIAAANKAIFKIAQMQNVFENIRRFCIDLDGMRTAPDRALRMDSPQPSMLEKITFNLDELGFLLDAQGDRAQVVMDLSFLEWQFQVVRQTIDLRAHAREEFEIARRERPANGPLLGLASTVYRAEFAKLSALTDQLVTNIDEGLKSTHETNAKLQAALQTVFPGQNFLQIRFWGSNAPTNQSKPSV